MVIDHNNKGNVLPVSSDFVGNPLLAGGNTMTALPQPALPGPTDCQMPRPKGKTIVQQTSSRTALAKNLPILLAAHGWSVQQLADKCGVSVRAIRDMINLKHDTGLSNVDKVAGALGLQGWHLLLEDTDQQAYRVIMEVLQLRRSGDQDDRKQPSTTIRARG